MWKQGDLIQCRYLFVEKQLQVTFTLVSKGHKNLNDSLLPIIPTTTTKKTNSKHLDVLHAAPLFAHT